MKKDIRTYKTNGVQFAYFLDHIDGAAYDVDLRTDKEKIDFLFKVFRAEKVDRDQRHKMTEQDYLTEYLQGLPSIIRIPFSGSEIAELGKAWGYCQNARKTAEFVSNFFRNSAYRLIQIRDYYKA